MSGRDEAGFCASCRWFRDESAVVNDMIQSRHPDGKTALPYLAVCCLFFSACSLITGPEETGLSVSPESLDFGVAFHSLPITVSCSGSESFQWHVSEMPEWLTVSPSSGTAHKADTSLQATVTRFDLNDGSYTAAFTISSDGEEVTVPVSMKVDGPYLHVSESELNFGTALTAISVVISNIGNGILKYQIITSKDWISVSPVSGEIANQPQEVVVTVDRTELSPGDYSTDLMIKTVERQLSVDVSVSIPPDG